MTIQLPTGQNWSVQLVCIGSRVLLEASHDHFNAAPGWAPRRARPKLPTD